MRRDAKSRVLARRGRDWLRPKGRLSINLAANSGVTFRYCHLNKVMVTSGPVKAGQQIATNGKTGNAIAAHVHFVYINAPNVTTSGALSQRSSKVNQYIDSLCRISP